MRAWVFAISLCVAGGAAASDQPVKDDGKAARVLLAQKKKAKKGGKKEEAPAAPSATGDPRNAKPDALPLDAARPQNLDDGGEAPRGPSRIEFDERLIQGQTNKANAIYLFERRESALRSLLKKRVDFHEEIDEALE